MKPTDELIHEHNLIQDVLNAAEREVKIIRQTGTVDLERMTKMMDFFQNYADKCHHAKEEKFLLVKMRERSADDTGSVTSVILDHLEGRRLLSLISSDLPAASKGDANAIESVANNLESYVFMLRNHIKKEDKFIFPRANVILTNEDQSILEKEFGKIECGVPGDKYLKIARELTQ
jgi:hemerythrin-like domain-containing protein